MNNNNRAYLDGMTHLITARGKLTASHDELAITINNQFPAWISESSTSSDLNPASAGFATTTFGLDRFLRGIYDAFAPGNATYGNIIVKLED